MPKRISRPPAATSPAGQVSAASEVAEPPRISTMSPSAARDRRRHRRDLVRDRRRRRHRQPERRQPGADRLGALGDQALA